MVTGTKADEMKKTSSITPVPRTVTCALTLFTALAGFSFGQDTPPARPTPTPDDVPEIVSRDADIERLIRERTTEVPAESEDRSASEARQPEERSLPLDSLSVAQQRKILLYLDILTKLEQRVENLRSQLIGLTEKENGVSTRIQQLEYGLRPEVIESSTAVTGSLRPEAVRDLRKTDLEIEKKNLENLLSQIESSRASIESNLQKADEMAEKMRIRFEAVLDAALSEESP